MNIKLVFELGDLIDLIRSSYFLSNYREKKICPIFLMFGDNIAEYAFTVCHYKIKLQNFLLVLYTRDIRNFEKFKRFKYVGYNPFKSEEIHFCEKTDLTGFFYIPIFKLRSVYNKILFIDMLGRTDFYNQYKTILLSRVEDLVKYLEALDGGSLPIIFYSNISNSPNGGESTIFFAISVDDVPDIFQIVLTKANYSKVELKDAKYLKYDMSNRSVELKRLLGDNLEISYPIIKLKSLPKWLKIF